MTAMASAWPLVSIASPQGRRPDGANCRKTRYVTLGHSNFLDFR